MINELLKDGRLNQRVVAYQINSPLAFVGRNGQQTFNYEMRKQRGIFASGKSNDPRFVMGLEIFFPQLTTNCFQLCAKAFGW